MSEMIISIECVTIEDEADVVTSFYAPTIPANGSRIHGEDGRLWHVIGCDHYPHFPRQGSTHSVILFVEPAK